MKKIVYLVLAVVLVLGFLYVKFDWNPFEGEAKEAETIDFNTFYDLKKDESNDGKRIALEGYLHIGFSVQQDIMGSKKNNITLYKDTISGISGSHVQIPIAFEKDGKDAFYVPYNYTEEEAIYYDHEGNAHPYNTKFKVSFTMEKDASKIGGSPENAWIYDQVRIDPIK